MRTTRLESESSPPPRSISESPITLVPPDGVHFLGQQVTITTPATASASDPIALGFTIDCMRFYPATGDMSTARAVTVWRDGDRVPACDEKDVAAPETCISRRRLAGEDDVRVEVLTLTPGTWTFSLHDGQDADGDRIADGADACPSAPEDFDRAADRDGCPELSAR